MTGSVSQLRHFKRAIAVGIFSDALARLSRARKGETAMEYQRPFRAIATEHGEILILDANARVVTDFPRSGTIDEDLQRANAIAAVDVEDFSDD